MRKQSPRRRRNDRPDRPPMQPPPSRRSPLKKAHRPTRRMPPSRSQSRKPSRPRPNNPTMGDANGPRKRGTSRRPQAPIPLNVLTGFLGAGKTTLLNRLLKDEALAKAAVIINEFGEIGLDHLLVEHIEDGVMLLSTGCLCCTVRGDLVNTLEKLLRGLDNARMQFNRVIIETTGLADPAPVLHTVMAHPYMALRFRLDGVIAVV